MRAFHGERNAQAKVLGWHRPGQGAGPWAQRESTRQKSDASLRELTVFFTLFIIISHDIMIIKLL